MHLQGKVAIVTGASRGLGQAIALELDAHGCSVVLSARSLPALQEVGKTLSHDHLIVEANLHKIQDIKKVFTDTIRRFGRCDILVNNAGMSFKKPFFEYLPEEVDKIFSLNTRATILTCMEAHNHMEGGTIATISSLAGWFSAKDYSMYSATKHALGGFVKGAKKEAKNFRFHLFHPFRLQTSFTSGYTNHDKTHQELDPKYYAQYVVASIGGHHLKWIWYLARNTVLWVTKIILH